MNDLCIELGYNSINHVGEELCGDHVETAGQGEDSQVLVLADGLGSGVKANILSILTSRIISTMIAEGLPLEECVKAIAATLRRSGTRPQALDTATARSALLLLAQPEPERLKICPNCHWLFLDRSRNRSRAWCDMAVCGNRAKASRHYHRNREEKGP